ncbi:MAG: GatB/YqeY domain-containing protein [Anaerolineae bacterium]|jgi:uncharacterized protein YqeY|nr:GatB/YqeY domain-containing protein [Anaerolineae bacterium]
MGTKAQIDTDLRNAMRSGDRLRTDTLRGLKSAIKYAEIEAGGELDEQDLLGVIAKQAKQRRDSIDEFEKAGRTDLVEQETAELAIIEQYLPAQMSEAEIQAKAEAVISELGVTDQKGMGLVMKQLMADLKGQADGKLVSNIVRQLLSS